MGMNIDLFNDYAAQILAQLYEAFPVKTSVQATKLCGHSETNDFGIVIDNDGNESKYYAVAKGTIEWLWENDFISSNSEMMHGYLRDAVLTEKGLAVLNSIPESVQTKQTLGDHLTKAVKTGGKETARELLKAVLARGVGIVAGAI